MFENYSSFVNLDSLQMKNLMQCFLICKECSHLCIEEGHKKTAQLCQECSEICELCLKYKCSNSHFVKEALSLCALVCKQCADECGKMRVLHCQECAKICALCSETCGQPLNV